MESFTLEDVKQRLKEEKYQAALSGGTVSPTISDEDEAEDAKDTKDTKDTNHPNLAAKCKVKRDVDILYRGVSIGFLVALTDSFNLKDYETYRVVKEFITPITANPKPPSDNDCDDGDDGPCRFSELVYFSQYFGKADTFVSHCWRGKWGDLVAAVSNGYPLSRKVWIDVFAVTQHPQLEALQDDLNALEYVLENVSQGTTLVWNPLIQKDDTSNPLLRAWCLFEIHITVIKDNALVIKMGQQGEQFSVATDDGVLVDFIPENDEDIVTNLVFQTDIRQAKASVPEDLERIHSMIQKQGGFDELNTRVRTAVYNNWRILQIPAVQDALSGSEDRLRESIINHNPATYGGDPGGSVLHDCVHGNFVAAAKLAIDCGAHIDQQTDKGNTPLMFAADGGRTKMCQLLLESGASLDLQNGREESALHLAAKYGRVEAVKLLLQQGASTKLLDSGNYTPAGLAGLNKMPGCKEALKILQQHDLVGHRSRSFFFCCLVN